jgi:hypothetical protein
LCGPRRGSLRERERETEEYKAAREGSSLRSGWKKRGRRTPVSFRVELTRRGKTKAKQRKAKPKEPKQKLVYYYYNYYYYYVVALQFSLSRRV